MAKQDGNSLLKLLLLAAIFSWAQVGALLYAKGSSGADFLKIGSGARTSAMGEAYVAVADDLNSASWNPAGLSEISRPSAGFMHLVYLADISYQSYGFAYPLGRWGTAAISGIMLSVPPFNSTNPAVHPDAATGKAGDMAMGCSYGIKVMRTLSVGFGVKMISRELSGYKASGIALDGGVIIQPWRRVRLGASMLNMGSDVTFIEEGDPLPTSLRLGLAALAWDKAPVKANLSVEYAHYLKGGEPKLGIGAECWFFGLFALRGGYKTMRDVESIAAGVGLKYEGLEAFTPQFDYAFVPYANDLGLAHRVSATISMGVVKTGPLPPAGMKAKREKKKVKLSWPSSLDWDTAGYNAYRRLADGSYEKMNYDILRESRLVLADLKPGKYDFVATSVSADGEESLYSGAASVTIGKKKKVKKRARSREVKTLQAPAGLSAEIKGERVRLEWRKSGGKVAGYRVYMSKDGRKFKKITPKLRRSTSLTLGVPAGQDYYFTVRAVGPDGAVGPYSRKVHVEIEASGEEDVGAPLAAPRGFRGEAGEGRIKLYWQASDGDVRGYHVYRVVKGQKKRLTSKAVSKTSLSLGGLKKGVKYSFFVTAVDVDGQESASSKVLTMSPGP